MNSLKHINDPVYHTINNFKKSRNIWRNILYNYTFDIKAAVPISLFPISGNKVQWLEKGNAVFFKLRQKSEENQESQEWEVWSKPKKTWTNQKCCMAKANALLLVGWPCHKWGQRRPLLQSTKPINQSLQVWPPILAEASNQQSPYIQVKSTNFDLPYILAPIGTSHHHVSQYWLEQVSEINTLLKNIL